VRKALEAPLNRSDVFNHPRTRTRHEPAHNQLMWDFFPGGARWRRSGAARVYFLH